MRRGRSEHVAVIPGLVALAGAIAAVVVVLKQKGDPISAMPAPVSWPMWLAVRLPAASAMLVAGLWLTTRGTPARREASAWVLASVLLALIAAAGRLALLEAQLLVLAGLTLLWCGSLRDRKDEGGQARVIGRAGRSVLLAATLGVGLTAAVHIGVLCREAVRAEPAWNILPPVEQARVLAEFLLAKPSLRRVSVLWTDAACACGFSIGLAWASVVGGRPGLLLRVLVGMAAAAAGVRLAWTGPWSV